MVNRASSSDEPEQIKRISQDIERANNVWRSWCLSVGGTVIELNGDHGRLEVPSSALTDLSKIATQYSEAVGSPVSVGVGFKLSQADKASKAARMQGGDRVLLYTTEVDKQLEQDKEEDKESAVELRPYVLKENPIQKSQPALAQGAGAGMTGASMSHAAAPTAPTAEGSEHTQGEVAANTIADAPPVPEGTHAAKDAADFEGMFHQLAEQGHSEDAGRPPMDPQQQQKLDQLRAGVIKTLQAVKGQDVEQLKQVSPQLYQSVVGMTQAMIQLAQQVFGDNQIQKAEELLDTVSGFHSELRKAWPKDAAENQANADSNAVLHDVLEEQGTPVKTRNLADELDTKVSQIQPPLPDARQDDYFRRIHGAIRSNRAKLAPERDVLLAGDPNFNNIVPEQPSSQHWSGDGSLAFGERGNEDRQADTRFWSAVDTVTGPQEAGPVDQSDIMLRSPIMRMKKAWPRDEHENLANAAAHPVMEDAILEQGGTKTPYGPHEAATAISRAVGKQGLNVKARSAQAQEGVDEASTWEEGNRNYESDLLRGVNAQRQLQGLPRTDSSVPLEPHNSWGVGASYPASPEAQRQAGQRPARNPNHGDGYNDHQFWATADVLSEPGVVEPAPVSNASQVPNKAEMQTALARSPIMKRNAVTKLNKALPRNEHENLANAAAHPVMEDAILEGGGTKTDESEGLAPAIPQKIASIRAAAESPSGNPLDWPWSYPGYQEAYAQEQQRADEASSPIEPNDVASFGGKFPSKASQSHPYIDDRHRENDHQFWDGITNSIGQETVSNATQIPDKTEMKSAMARSPIMSRAKQDMSKAALEAGKTGRHNVVLPPGSQIDSSGAGTKQGGRIKVLKPDGTSAWRSVRAGVVRAPDGTPTSSRNPSPDK